MTAIRPWAGLQHRRQLAEGLRRRLTAAELEAEALGHRLQDLVGDDPLACRLREIVRQLVIGAEQTETRLRARLADAVEALAHAEGGIQ